MNKEIWIDDTFAANVIDDIDPEVKKWGGFGGERGKCVNYRILVDKHIPAKILLAGKVELKIGDKTTAIAPYRTKKILDNLIIFYHFKD
jgi:hypothetical protein